MNKIRGGAQEVTANAQQMKLTCAEAHNLWANLSMHYDAYEKNSLYENYVNDADFNAILMAGKRKISQNINQLETVMDKVGIQLPPRTPKSMSKAVNSEALTDDYIFRSVYMGVQDFIDEHVRGIRNALNPEIRQTFIKMLQEEIDQFADLTDYGKLKGWLRIPPHYHSPT